ncbi:MAG: UPF0182 family protein [Acidimicrobiia bacterium]|nr:UPF0182 family protein [Acidimicrobiia bacterium]
MSMTGPRGPGGPRTPPAPVRSRRLRRSLFIAIAAVIIVLVSLRGAAGFYTDFLWFEALGQADVWRTIILSRIVLALIFVAFLFALLYGNLSIADRMAPAQRPGGPEEDVLARYHASMGQRPRLVRLGVTLLFALPIGAGASDQWEEWLLLTNSVEFGAVDPIDAIWFGNDVGFYVFQLPFLTYIVNWLFNVFLLTFFITAIAHYVNGGIRFQKQGQRVTPQVKAHLSVLLGALALIKAADYFLGRYELTTSTSGVVDGATYTDLNARLPVHWLLILISLLAFVLLIVNIRLKGWVLPTLAVGLWAFVAIVMGGIYPLIIQRLRVEPAESTREQEYIEYNIASTRLAMGLDDVKIRTFDSTGGLTYDGVARSEDIIGNLPLLDPAILPLTYENREGERNYYQFSEVLDVDRYEIDGQVTPVVLGARQLNPGNLPQTSWEARTLTFTHGFGVALAPANTVEAGLPDFRIGGLPVTNNLGIPLDEPRLYYGEELDGYAIVKTDRQEVDVPTATGEEASYTYQGDGGVEIGGFFRQASFALRFWEVDPLLSGFITDESKVIYVRDVRARVKKLAPFLHIDNDPYPVLAEGRVQYIVDAYTTTSKFPYGQRADTEQLGDNSGLRHRFNYVRNSVKAVVDGFDGTTTLYVVDPDDPILRAYRNIFPDLFEDFENMPAELMEHIRYPEDLFRVQTNVWARYQLDNPQEFYEQAKGWSVAQDPGAVTGVLTSPITTPDGVVQQPSREARIDPYYLLTRLPEEDDQDFVILRSYVPVSTEDTRRELTAFMVGKSDPDEYGELVVYKVEPLGLTDGPALVNSKIQSDPSISRVVTLLNQQGSRVEFGDLVLVPVEDSILYVRPLYVVAQSPPVPELQQVIAVLGERVVMCPTLDEALRGLFGLTLVSDSQDASASSCVGNTAGLAAEIAAAEPAPAPPEPAPAPPEPAPAPAPPVPPGEIPDAVGGLIERAVELFAEADAALRDGRLDLYQQRIEEAEELIRRASEELGDTL